MMKLALIVLLALVACGGPGAICSCPESLQPCSCPPVPSHDSSDGGSSE
jgi:hypothetical protein